MQVKKKIFCHVNTSSKDCDFEKTNYTHRQRYKIELGKAILCRKSPAMAGIDGHSLPLKALYDFCIH